MRNLFLFVDGLNGHHQEWLGSTTMNRHGVEAFDFTTVSGCDQLDVGPTHVCGGTLDLLITDVLDLVGGRFDSTGRSKLVSFGCL